MKRTPSQTFILLAMTSASIFMSPQLSLAQEGGGAVNALTNNSVSEYGVSFYDGSYNYNLPILQIGNGDFPNSLNIYLNYNSTNQDSATSSPADNSGWTLSGDMGASAMVTVARYSDFDQFDEPSNEPLHEQWQYGAYFNFGPFSKGFEITSYDLDSKQFFAITKDGSHLDYYPVTPPEGTVINGWDFDYGEFVFMDRNGGELRTNVKRDNGLLEFEGDIYFQKADGLSLKYNSGYSYWQRGLTAYARWKNSIGLVVVKENVIVSGGVSSQKICSYNLAYHDESVTFDCNSSVNVTTLKFGIGATITEVVRSDGVRFNFEYLYIYDIKGYTALNNVGDQYKLPKGRYKLSCIKEGGSSSCLVRNYYDACDGYSGQGFVPQGLADSGWSGRRDRVIRQDLADGRVINYSYPGQSIPCRDVSSVIMSVGGFSRTVQLQYADNAPLEVGYLSQDRPMVRSVTNENGEMRQFIWTGSNPATWFLGKDDLLQEVIFPEGNIRRFVYDERGNVLQELHIPKAGSGASSIVSAATFPQLCTNSKTCNKPETVADALGAVTSFTYSSDHGGVVTAVPPAVNGVSPAVKYGYVQRTPWLKSGSGYVAGDPIWLLADERSCKTSALDLSNGTCSAGSSDLIIKAYDYGPDAGPNNLWLRGIAIAADGQTLRTCFGYDGLGRRISETQPLAGLASCP